MGPPVEDGEKDWGVRTRTGYGERQDNNSTYLPPSSMQKAQRAVKLHVAPLAQAR